MPERRTCRTAVLAAAAIAAAAMSVPAARADAGGHGKAEGHAKPKAHGHGKGTAGHVYVETNDPRSNAVVVFRRAANGALTQEGTYPTGGAGGSGRTTLPVPVADSQGPLALTSDGRLLFATNVGSGTVTSFRVKGDRLVRIQTVPSRGELPSAVDAAHGLMYVTNAKSDTMTGYHYDSKGHLTAIAGSTQTLTPDSELAAVVIDRHGKFLVVNERDANFVTRFPLSKKGVPGAPQRTKSSGVSPFGLNLTRNDIVVTADAGGFPVTMADSSISSYGGRGSGALAPIDSKPDQQTSSCWIVFSKDEKYGFATGPISQGITVFRLSRSGNITVLGNGSSAHPPGTPTDEDRSVDSKYLYVVVLDVTFLPPPAAPEFKSGRIVTYRIGGNGSLTQVAATPAAGLPGTTSGLQAR